MDIEQIKCVLAVVRCRSFLEASFYLNRSQSSVSKEIKKLENELGVQLFSRTTRSVVLTAAGRNFVPYGEQMLNTYQEMLTAMTRSAGKDEILLRIGSIYFGQNNRIAPLIAEFMNRNPALKIQVHDDTTTPLLEALRSGSLDVIFASSMYDDITGAGNFSSNPEFRSFSCFRDPYYVIVSREHPFASRKSLSVPDLDGQAFILTDPSMDVYHRALKRFLEYYHVRIHTSLTCSSVRSVLHMVSQNLGIAVLSRLVIEESDDLVIIPLEGGLIRDTQILVLNRRQPAQVNAFWNFICERLS